MIRPLFRRPSNRAQIAARRAWVPPSKAPIAAPTLSAPAVFNITTTTARPRVTVTF